MGLFDVLTNDFSANLSSCDLGGSTAGLCEFFCKFFNELIKHYNNIIFKIHTNFGPSAHQVVQYCLSTASSELIFDVCVKSFIKSRNPAVLQAFMRFHSFGTNVVFDAVQYLLIFLSIVGSSRVSEMKGNGLFGGQALGRYGFVSPAWSPNCLPQFTHRVLLFMLPSTARC